MITGRLLAAGIVVLGLSAFMAARSVAFQGSGPPIVGRWDLTVHSPQGDYPSWIEVTHSGHKTLVGRLVARVGSSRPISQVFFETGKFHFALPVQWEAQTGEMRYEGTVSGDRIEGVETDHEGKTYPFAGVRQAMLTRSKEPEWDRAIELFDGNSMAGWHKRWSDRPNGWEVRDELLKNVRPGNDLVTDRTFTDFKVHAEFRYPKDSNSGIYLRGRYEAQIEDNYGRPADSHIMGGIYGFLQPRINAAKKPGEWQSYDIILVGRTVTIVLNGELLIDRQEIPGITGGALDSDEAAPGPLLIQGDHGPIDFRKVTITPAL